MRLLIGFFTALDMFLPKVRFHLIPIKMDGKTRQKSFLYLFERIGQPLHLSTRGYGKHQVLYNIPQERLNQYEIKAMMDIRKNLSPSSNPEIINVSNTIKPYDLTPVQVVPRLGVFCDFSPHHRKAMHALIKIFMEQPTTEEFFNACASCRDSVNPHLWLYAYVTACLFRKDMKGFVIPPPYEIVPDMFFQHKFIREAQKQAQLPPEDRAILIIGKEFTGFDLNPENKLAYFLEDMQVCSHHWHWHLANPRIPTPETLVIDRKGEIFYYMHHSMLARYTAERLCNGLNRTVPYSFEGALAEGYFSKLTLQNSGHTWGTRQANSMPSDLNRLNDNLFGGPWIISLASVRRTADRILEACDAGFALGKDGKKVDLLNEQGVSILGGMIESSSESINPVYYDSFGLHNWGHTLLAGMHDPDFRYKEPLGILGSTLASIKDPAFFRWHQFIDNIFTKHKTTLPPYTKQNLTWTGISIQGLEIQTPSFEPNSLLTHWMETDVDLLRGLDFDRFDGNNLGPVWARVTHLQHRDFDYHIKIQNDGGSVVLGTLRIFLAPKLDEQKDPLPFSQQRNLFFELDRFSAILRPGTNMIKRRSQDSNLTIPWAQAFGVVERKIEQPIDTPEAFCGCGWPAHMLLPKGTFDGMPFDLFVMVTDGSVDAVPGTSSAKGTLTETGKLGCKDSASFCGVLHEKYPDSRPMNYPFDRPPLDDETTGLAPQFVADFVKPHPNMITAEVKIFHRSTTVLREGGAPNGMRKISISDFTRKHYA